MAGVFDLRVVRLDHYFCCDGQEERREQCVWGEDVYIIS